MQAGLTVKQASTLKFIADFIADNGHSPSYDEIKDWLGESSKSGVHRLITGLKSRGHITSLRGQSRSISVIAP